MNGFDYDQVSFVAVANHNRIPKKKQRVNMSPWEFGINNEVKMRLNSPYPEIGLASHEFNADQKGFQLTGLI